MTRRGFIGALLGAAVAPKTMFAATKPVSWRRDAFRYRFYPQTTFRPERIVIKLHTNSLYGKFAA